MDGYCFPQSRFDRALDPGMMQGGMFATEMDAPFRSDDHSSCNNDCCSGSNKAKAPPANSSSCHIQ